MTNPDQSNPRYGLYCVACGQPGIAGERPNPLHYVKDRGWYIHVNQCPPKQLDLWATEKEESK